MGLKIGDRFVFVPDEKQGITGVPEFAMLDCRYIVTGFADNGIYAYLSDFADHDGDLPNRDVFSLEGEWQGGWWESGKSEEDSILFKDAFYKGKFYPLQVKLA